MVIKLFKKYFIPHRHNDHKPHFLRLSSVVAILLLVTAIEALYLSQTIPRFSSQPYTALVLPNTLIDQTNVQREQNHLDNLRLNPVLTQAAQMKASDMAEKGYFSHNTPDGKTPWYWLGQAGYNFKTAGENLAVNYVDSTDVTNAWMNSPTHRANILKAGFSEIGIATAQGIYKGEQAIFVVQFFGTPTSPIIAAIPTQTLASSRPTTLKSTSKVNFQKVVTTIPVAEVKSASVTEMQIELETSDVQTRETLPTDQEKVRYATTVQQWLSSPSHSLTIFFVSIIFLIIFALLLKIFIKIKIQHPALIANGIIAILIISSILIFNAYLQAFGQVI